MLELEVDLTSSRQHSIPVYNARFAEPLGSASAVLHIITVIKSRRMRWTVHVTCLREMRNA